MIVRDSVLRVVFGLIVICYIHSCCKHEISHQTALLRTLYLKHCATITLYENLPVNTQYGISCEKVVQDDSAEVTLGRLKMLEARANKRVISSSWPDEAISSFINKNSCATFKTARQYVEYPLSDVELDFPLAYSIVVHRDAGLAERLLRSIYRSQNFYCFHVDQKASPEFYDAMNTISKCFPNVFLSEQREDVIYSHFSRLQADLNCMKTLTSNGLKWRYFINLCGQDFPLKTNGEMVQYLKAIYPQNSIESFILPGHKISRYNWVYNVTQTEGEYSKGLKRTDIKKGAPPINFPLFGGSAYMVATREFVDWVMHNETIQAIVDWSKDTYSPDEMLWATLVRLRGAPGYRHHHLKWDLNELQTIVRIVKWHSLEEDVDVEGANPVYPKCHGYHKRGICVYGLGDIGWLLNRDHFFANKFDDSSNGDDFAIQCIEETLRIREYNQACELDKK